MVVSSFHSPKRAVSSVLRDLPMLRLEARRSLRNKRSQQLESSNCETPSQDAARPFSPTLRAPTRTPLPAHSYGMAPGEGGEAGAGCCIREFASASRAWPTPVLFPNGAAYQGSGGRQSHSTCPCSGSGPFPTPPVRCNRDPTSLAC